MHAARAGGAFWTTAQSVLSATPCASLRQTPIETCNLRFALVDVRATLARNGDGALVLLLAGSCSPTPYIAANHAWWALAHGSAAALDSTYTLRKIIRVAVATLVPPISCS